MTPSESPFASLPTPTFLTGDDSDWAYYVGGHDSDALWVIDDPAVLIHEPLWMRPQRVSSVDPDERGDGWETVVRDERGRYQPAYCWIECRPDDPDARPFMGARYKPVSG